MKITTAMQRIEVLVRKTHRPAKSHRLYRQPPAMADGRRIACLDRQRERHERRLRGVERVNQILHARQRSHASPQFVRMNRFLEDLVGAGVEAAEAVLSSA